MASLLVAEEKLEKIIRKVLKEIKDEIIRDIFKDLVDILREILKTLRELTEAQRKTEQRLNELAEAQRKTEQRLNELIGEVARIRGEIIEYRVISDLGRIFGKYGLLVYSAPYDIREIDAIVEGDGFYALVEICKKCDLRDIRQILEGAKKFSDIEGVRPDMLIIFSYTGQIDPKVMDEAQKHNIIVEHNIRRLARLLMKNLKKK